MRAGAESEHMRRAEEAEITRFLAENGATRLPPAFAAPSPQRALDETEAHLLIWLLSCSTGCPMRWTLTA